MGAMGFALPCAIGASIATGKMTIAICGDGGMQMNIQELEIIRRRNLPVKVFVLNNRCLGMVRQFQEKYFDGVLIGTRKDYSAPDFAKIGRAYGLKSISISPKISLNRLKKIFDIYTVFSVSFKPDTLVQPKLMLGVPIVDMSPSIPRDILKNFLPDGYQNFK